MSIKWKMRKGKVTIDGEDYGKIKSFDITIEDTNPSKSKMIYNVISDKIVTVEVHTYLPLHIRIKNWIIDKWKSLKGVN